ncbi:MAG: flagellar basal body rod protein FlgB [Kineosporiaceae bacterium]
MLEDVSIDTLQAAMHGLSARQQAISDDIANVDTPFYRAHSVTFEASLKSALDAGQNPLTVQPTTTISTAPAGLNGNNVDITAETTQSVDTELAFQLALRAAGDRFGLYRTAIAGS